MSEALSESGRYLATLDRDRRRATGVVYTPDAIVELVLDQEFGPGEAPEGPVLDPACGAGAFPTAIVARIAARLGRQGTNIRTAPGRRGFLAEIERLVWAIDVDSGAVRVTLQEVLGLIEKLAPGPISADYLADNIVVGDFLADDLPFPGATYRHVVGNPPYVPINRIEVVNRRNYRERFSSATGRTDLYYLFMERSTEVLVNGGSWTLITPDKFLSSQTGHALRSLLLDRGSVRTLSLFTSHSVFRDAATVPCITTWANENAVSTEQRRIEISSSGTPRLTADASVPRTAFQTAAWTFHSDQAGSLLAAISADHPRLAQRTERISAGPATGYNPAFIVDAKTAASLDEELLHPTARGRDVDRFTIKESGSWMVVPYVWDTDGNATLVELERYPRTRSWLERNRRQLEARHAVRKWGKAWWDLHDPVTLPLHKTAKVLVPDVARRNRFAFDPGKYIPQHSAYYLLPSGVDAAVLTAILNSAPIELVIRSTAPRVKDGFSRYRRQYLLNIPVPIISPALADQIRDAVDSENPEVAAELAATVFNVDGADVSLAINRLSR